MVLSRPVTGEAKASPKAYLDRDLHPWVLPPDLVDLRRSSSGLAAFLPLSLLFSRSVDSLLLQ